MNTVKKTKAYKGPPMEGLIANWYARLTLKDLNRHRLMASQLVKRIPAGARVLEIAPGPGYFCIELAKLGEFQITGLDISKSFMEIARNNAARAGLQIDFQQGNASEMPFEDETFDFTFCQAAFKNFAQPVQAISEMYRVLRSGGMSVIVDMRSDASLEEIERELKNMHLGRVDEMTTRWTFKHMLLKTAYGIDEMRDFAAQTPFGDPRVDVSGIGFQLWMEK